MLKADYGVNYPKDVICDTQEELNNQFIKVILSWHEALLMYINKNLKIHSRNLMVDNRGNKTSIYINKANESILMYTISFGVNQIKENDSGDAHEMKLDISIKSWNEYNVDMDILKKYQEKYNV